jgi:hypothetical protein
LCLRGTAGRAVGGIIVQDVGIDPRIAVLLLQIGNLVGLDLGAIGVEGVVILRQALVAAVGREFIGLTS